MNCALMEVIIMMDSDLGAKVKKLRISHGLTQEDVAKALDVTPGYISNVENGRNLMTLRMYHIMQNLLEFHLTILQVVLIRHIKIQLLITKLHLFLIS